MDEVKSPQPCLLGFPDRFTEAAKFVGANGGGLSEESKLLLYSLHQQATVGPCNEPKPWGWSVVNNAKWQAWKQLGDLSGVEAMRLYVRTLEEEIPNWWEQHSASAAVAAPAPAPVNGAAAAEVADGAPAPPPPAATGPRSRSVAEVVVEGSWVSPYISSEKRPPPRYEHATAIIDKELFIVGGNYGGRYLNDTWALNLENLTWKAFVSSSKSSASLPASTAPGSGEVPPPPPTLPGIAGHVAVPWQGNVVLVGGHMKAKDALPDMPVRLMDSQSGAWSTLECGVAEEGEELPKPRGGHSGCLLGSQLIVFGGEDVMRRPLAELLVLDLQTMLWSRPETTGKAPGPRSAHAATIYRDRYMLVFGGGSVAHCNNELWVLDTHTMEWFQPESEGPVPPPRAGHAGSVLGDTWFIVGGGNNTSGCADMYALDLSLLGSGPVQWTLVGNTPVESAIASEGLSLLPVPFAACVVSFGGYNGRYHNAVHVYRPEGYLAASAAAPQPKPAAAEAVPEPAAQQNGSGGGSTHGGAAPANAASAPTPIPPPAPAAAAAPAAEAAAAAAAAAGEYERKIAELEAARREAVTAREAVVHEVAIMRRQLDSAQAAAAEAEKAVEEARAALEEEQGKSMRLEVELAEARKQLGRMEELEREMAKHRLSNTEKKGSGIWGYISGQ